MSLPFPFRRRRKDACLACGGVFPGSSELASVSRGTQFIVDVASRRAWRQCAACGAAELMGKEAGEALVHEVVARAHPDSKATPSYVTFGTVDILLAGQQDMPVALRVSSAIDLLARVRKLVRTSRAVDIALVVILSIGFGWRQGFPGVLSVLHLLTLFVAAMFLQKAIGEFKHRRAAAIRRMLLAVLAVGGWILVAPSSSDTAWLSPIATVATVVVMTLAGVAADSVFRKLYASKRKPMLPEGWIYDATVSLMPEAGELSIVGADGRQFAGRAAVQALTQAVALDMARLSPEQAAAAAELSATYCTPTSIAAVLRSIRPEDDGRYRWGDLPPVWRGAISLTLMSDDRDLPLPRHVINLQELNRIADIADSLDSE